MSVKSAKSWRKRPSRSTRIRFKNCGRTASGKSIISVRLFQKNLTRLQYFKLMRALSTTVVHAMKLDVPQSSRRSTIRQRTRSSSIMPSNYSRLETRLRSKMSSKIPTISREQQMSRSRKSRLLTLRASLELLRTWLVVTRTRKISLTLFSNLSWQSSNYAWRRLQNLRHPWLPVLAIRSRQPCPDRPSDARKCCQTFQTSG